MGVLLNEGIGDTIRVSLTPRPGRRSPRRGLCGVRAAAGARAAHLRAERHRVPGLRPHRPARTFQELAERVQGYIREQMPFVEERATTASRTLTLAVMGCVVNGPGESKAANIGISLPGTGEAPNCPVYHRRRSRHDAARHLRRARRRVPDAP